MRKHLCVILFVLLLSAMLASAAPINILLTSPADKATITEYSQTFIFGFDQNPADILNCSLIANNEVQGFRNSLIIMNNNKITAGLEGGDYTWHISCLDKSLNVIDSDARTLTIDVGSTVKEGYDILYNLNGIRTYVLTIASGQKEVTLPAIKGGEYIEIKMGGKPYYLDIIKMGADINSDFVDIRDRTSGKPHHMLVPSTLEFDFNNDKTIDIALELKNVERGVNAYFVVTPYPATTPAENAPEENPTQPVETPSETPTTTQPQPKEQPAAQAPVKQTQKEPSGQQLISGQENTKSKSSWLIAIILVIVLAIVLAIVLSSKARKLEKKTTKKDAKKEMPEQEQDQRSVQQEKFDIIKSTGRKR
jgi:hypothetical protein